jgi:hypothetical protein
MTIPTPIASNMSVIKISIYYTAVNCINTCELKYIQRIEEVEMAKINVSAITQTTSLAAIQFAALEQDTKAVEASEFKRRERSLRLISSGNGFSALIKRGKMAIQTEGKDFAITTQN